MTRERFRGATIVLLAAIFSVLLVVVPTPPAKACSCAVTTAADAAEFAAVAFVGTELVRVDTNRRDFDSVLVTFSVEQWLSHANGPTAFQAFTGLGDADCGLGPVRGQVAVFVHGTIEDPNVSICGSIQPVDEAIAAFAGRVLPDYPIPIEEPPPATVGTSYTDLVIPMGVGSLLIAGFAFAFTRRRTRRIEELE